MKMSLRTGTFETNSSSVHAIVIDTSGEEEEYPSFGNPWVELGDYGRRSKLLTDSEARISYVWTGIWSLKQQYGGDIPEGYRYPEIFERTKALPDLDWWKRYILRVFGFDADGYDHPWNRKFQDTPSYLDENLKFDPHGKYRDRLSEKLLRHFKGFRFYENFYWESRWINYGVDHVSALIPFLERISEDEKLFHDYIFGIGSCVMVSNDEGGTEVDIPKLMDGDLIQKALDDDWDRIPEWSDFHDFPERNRIIFIKEE